MKTTHQKLFEAVQDYLDTATSESPHHNCHCGSCYRERTALQTVMECLREQLITESTNQVPAEEGDNGD